jgi:hypothetical protein
MMITYAAIPARPCFSDGHARGSRRPLPARNVNIHLMVEVARWLRWKPGHPG